MVYVLHKPLYFAVPSKTSSLMSNNSTNRYYSSKNIYVQSISIHIYTIPICVLSSSVITYPTSIQIPAMTPSLAANTT